jgi:predicted nucleotidyltransferase
MLPTPYAALNQVLNDLVTRMQEILGDNFVGAYLQGSFAVGDFDIHSDVDFIVVINDELSPDKISALQEMHDQVYQIDSKWAQHLEGSYFPKEILRDYAMSGVKLWYLDNGASSLIKSDHCNTILVRWVVHEKGVVLAGPSPDTLVDPISNQLLRVDIFETIINWGQEILDDPKSFNNRFYQSFIVLSYCRMLHDLHNGYAGSKRAGAEWAKSALDPSWSELIDGTWDGRPNPAQQVQQPADPQDFNNTLKFVEYVMNKSRLFMAH